MELINKQYALASAISGIVITDENGEKWIRRRDVRESIMNVPIIDAEPVKHGHWVAMNDDGRGYADEFGCTNCSCVMKYEYFTKGCDYEWCPYCGAKMDEVEE